MLTDHGGASSQGCSGARVEVVNSNGAHERQLHVGVGVDTTWMGWEREVGEGG